MNVNLDDVIVRNDEQARRYEADVQGRRAVLEYQRMGNRIVFTHAGVPTELEGRGIASKMTHMALEEARKQNLDVIPRCPFVASYIRRHPEYQHLVPPDGRERFLRP